LKKPLRRLLVKMSSPIGVARGLALRDGLSRYLRKRRIAAKFRPVDVKEGETDVLRKELGYAGLTITDEWRWVALRKLMHRWNRPRLCRSFERARTVDSFATVRANKGEPTRRSRKTDSRPAASGKGSGFGGEVARNKRKFAKILAGIVILAEPPAKGTKVPSAVGVW